jgi:hypothetical protein
MTAALTLSLVTRHDAHRDPVGGLWLDDDVVEGGVLMVLEVGLGNCDVLIVLVVGLAGSA